MDSQLYISSAILGVFLAIVCIYGWRRIVPLFFFGLILVKVAPAQYGDYDDDVPAINEVRDAILAQKQMLDNYLNGYTAPNKLNDISNSLDPSVFNSIGYTNQDISTRTGLILDALTAGSGYSNNVYWKLGDISYLQSLTNSSVQTLPSQLDTDNDVPAIQALESLLSGYGQWDTDNDAVSYTHLTLPTSDLV